MWKAVFAVVLVSTSVMAEQAPGSHGGAPTQQQQSQQQVAQPDNTASLFLKLNSCLAQRPDTAELLKKAGSR